VIVRRNLKHAAIAAFCFIGLGLNTASAQVQELQSLAASSLGANQGVFVQAEDGTILVAQQDSRPVHPASVSKVATSLALLEQLGNDYRFETKFLTRGPIVKGSLKGDLVVHAPGDPTFVFENAFLMLRELHAQGLHEVAGDIKVEGPLLFNWKADPAGQRLKRALQGLDGGEAWAAISVPSAQVKKASLNFVAGEAQKAPDKVLAVDRSPSLITIVKALNGYSNNVFHMLSDRIGGPPQVEALMRKHVPAALQSQITITNGAGAGETNRLSPRAAVAILWALRKELRAHGKDLPSVLPVNGLDVGTLKHRLDEEPYRARIVGKTGTFGSVGACALVGVLHTDKYGYVAFAVLNSWVPVPEARRRQDVFLRGLIDATGAKPWDYVPSGKPIFAEATVKAK
jgi:D-alanyl-D-alanine carboxypeptidase/D-alanyl-D-alanine-endopeptidase (penicillin-binding protein 4)